MAFNKKLNRNRSGKFSKYRLDYFSRHIDLNNILKTIDLKRFNKIKEEYKGASPHPGWSKFLDIKKWMKRKIKIAYDFNLHRSEPLRILDIGSGAGYFAYVCQYLGHEVIATDVGDNPLYNELIDLLNVKRIVWAIKALEPLPDYGMKFDLVTAQKACFQMVGAERDWESGQWRDHLSDLTQDPRNMVWGIEQWRFFLKDLAANHISPNGRLHLNLNGDLNGRFYSAELLEFFQEHSASVDRQNISFQSMDSFLD